MFVISFICSFVLSNFNKLWDEAMSMLGRAVANHVSSCYLF